MTSLFAAIRRGFNRPAQPARAVAAPRQTTGKSKSLWSWAGKPVEAHTKSEARSKFKQRYKLPRLPIGAIVERIAALLLILLLAGSAIAAGPRAVIYGPTTGTPGELLLLDASQSQGDNLHFLWRVTPDIPGRRLFDLCDSGAKCRVNSMPGTWTYALVVSNVDGADLLFWTVTIPGTPQPQPTPTPGPAPPPTPAPGPVPPGPSPGPAPPGPASAWADTVRQLAEAVQSPNRAAEAKALASGAEIVATKIAAGTISGWTRVTLASNVLAAVLAENQKALGPALDAWKGFGTAYGAEVKKAYDAGKLTTGAEWTALLNETAAGLRAVK